MSRRRRRPSVAPIIGSSMVSATVVALALNLVFRIGVRKTARLTLEHGEIDQQKIQEFFEAQTATWGARPDVAKRATFGVLQLIDVVVGEFWSGGPVTIEASFDEFNLDVRVVYRGEAPPLPDRRPSNEEIMQSEQGARLLAGFMLRRNADRVRTDNAQRHGARAFPFRSLRAARGRTALRQLGEAFLARRIDREGIGQAAELEHPHDIGW